MNVATLAAVAVSANTALTRQEASVSAVKQTIENHTQAAVSLTQQVTDQAKAAAASASAGSVNIVI